MIRIYFNEVATRDAFQIESTVVRQRGQGE